MIEKSEEKLLHLRQGFDSTAILRSRLRSMGGRRERSCRMIPQPLQTGKGRRRWQSKYFIQDLGRGMNVKGKTRRQGGGALQSPSRFAPMLRSSFIRVERDRRIRRLTRLLFLWGSRGNTVTRGHHLVVLLRKGNLRIRRRDESKMRKGPDDLLYTIAKKGPIRPPDQVVLEKARTSTDKEGMEG